MAIPATLIHEVRTTGNDANAGGFDPANANFATDGTVDTNTGNTASPVFSSASYNFVTGDIGAWLFIKSGTNSIPGWYQIASVGSNKATLTASIGSAPLYNPTTPYSTINTAAGIATVGTPTGLTWGVDYSQQASAQIAYTDMVIGSAGAGQMTYTSAGNPVGKNIIGNVLNVTGGTGFTVQRVVVSSTSGTTATIVATGANTLGTASSTGGTGNLGGSFASLGGTVNFPVAGNTIYVKSGSYSITSASTNVANGCYTTSQAITIEGYNSVRTDMGTAPVLTASGISTFTVVNFSSNDCTVRNISVDCANLTAGKAFAWFRGTIEKCTGDNCKSGAFVGSTVTTHAIRCKATGCSSTSPFSGGGVCVGCEAYANTVTGFNTTVTCEDCLSYGNTGSASVHGFAMTNGTRLRRCVAYGNQGKGINANFISSGSIIDCIVEGNTDDGIDIASSTNVNVVNCGAYNNGTNLDNASASRPAIRNFIVATGSFFTNAASNDFSLNNTASQGALARAAGILGAFPRGTTTGYLDIGAAQHQDAGGSSNPFGGSCF